MADSDLNVAQMLVRCLELEGVRYIFGVPGEENEALLFALDDSEIEFVPTRHEQGAAFIANVWGRLTGQAGVCLSTLGPGATNLITGVADANLDKAPLVAITAQGALDRLHYESHQAIDVVQMFRPITKWNSSIQSPTTVTEVVRKAFKLAQAEKPGATHIELSEDVASQPVASQAGCRSPIEHRRVRRPAPDYKAQARALELLRGAKRPLVIAGNGAIRERSSRHLTKFVTDHDIPVVHTFMGKGAVDDRLPQSLYALGLGFRDHVMNAVDQADLFICVGYDVAEFPPERFNPGADEKIVHVDFEPAEVYTHYVPEVEVVGDISGTLWGWEQALEGETLGHERGWAREVRARIEADFEVDRRSDDAQATVPAALHVLRECLPSDGLLLSDVGSHKMWIARNFPVHVPGGCIISNGLASMGIALPGGIAASLVDPDRKVVAAMGDGGFLMNAAELETAVRLGVGFVCVVFNDEDYGLISWKQRQHRKRSVSTRIQNPDFVKFAESFGITAVRAETVGAFRTALSEALEDSAVRFIEVPVDPSVNDALLQRLDG